MWSSGYRASQHLPTLRREPNSHVCDSSGKGARTARFKFETPNLKTIISLIATTKKPRGYGTKSYTAYFVNAARHSSSSCLFFLSLRVLPLLLELTGPASIRQFNQSKQASALSPRLHIHAYEVQTVVHIGSPAIPRGGPQKAVGESLQSRTN